MCYSTENTTSSTNELSFQKLNISMLSFTDAVGDYYCFLMKGVKTLKRYKSPISPRNVVLHSLRDMKVPEGTIRQIMDVRGEYYNDYKSMAISHPFRLVYLQTLSKRFPNQLAMQYACIATNTKESREAEMQKKRDRWIGSL